MKKLLSILVTVLLLTSCGKKTEVTPITDYYVDKLSTTHRSYGLFSNESKVSENFKYAAKPIGRLIVVRILDNDYDTYEKLEKRLIKYYNGNRKVSDVYINQGGTIIIDCR